MLFIKKLKEETVMNNGYNKIVKKMAYFVGSMIIFITAGKIVPSLAAETISTGSAVIEKTELLASEDTISTTDTALTDRKINGEIIPLVVTEEKDISDISMNKLTFSFQEDIFNEDLETANLITEQIYTVNVTGKGGLYLAIAQADNIDFASFKMQIYSDSALTKKIGKDYIVKPDTKTIDTKAYYLKNAGMYYLKFTYQGKTRDAKSFAVSTAFMYSMDRTLKEGENLVAYADSKQRTIYYKVNIKKEGLLSYMAIPEDGNSLLTGYITLCDENKKAISVKEYVSGSKDNNKAIHTYYTITKGIYYIKVKLNKSYLASFTMEKVKDSAGKNMGTAKRIGMKKKGKKGAIYFSDSVETEKWYQFRLKKNQNFSIVINSCVNGYLNVEVCNWAGVTVKSGASNFYTGTKILKTSSKWQKGTYYIKITKSKKSKESSGYFDIKVTK